MIILLFTFDPCVVPEKSWPSRITLPLLIQLHHMYDMISSKGVTSKYNCASPSLSVPKPVATSCSQKATLHMRLSLFLVLGMGGLVIFFLIEV